MANRMNDFVLQQLLAENQRLRESLESCRKAIPISEACRTLIDYCNDHKSKDMLVMGDPTNPYWNPPKDGGCCTIM